MSEAAQHIPVETAQAADPLRPWRRVIPDVLTHIPPTVNITTPEGISEAIRAVITEHQIEVLRHAEVVNSDLNLDVFGHLPEETMRTLQLVGDVAARFLATDATQDDFITHPARSKFKGENNVLFGSAFKKVFEANRFRLSVCTGVISKLLQVREMVDPDFGRFARRSTVVIPRAAEFGAVVNRMLEAIGNMKTINDRYDKMPLLGTKDTQGKLDIVDAISVAAEAYIKLITEGPRPGEPVSIRPSPTSQGS
jgi:hypothetical protein